MIQLLAPIGPSLQRAIGVIEECHGVAEKPWSAPWFWDDDGSRAQSELYHWDDHPDRATRKTLARLVWDLAVEKSEPTVWLFRDFLPESSLALLLCTAARVPLKGLFRATVTDTKFNAMARRAARLGAAPLHVGRTPSTDAFQEALMLAGSGTGIVNAVCDWVPSTEELLIAKDSGLRVIFPDQPEFTL